MRCTGHLRAGALWDQSHHVIDILPAILEATGVEAPDCVNGIEQTSLDGVSMAYRPADTPGVVR